MSCLDHGGAILEPAARLFEKSHENGTERPTLGDSIQTIKELAQYAGITYIFIDALDECSRDSRQVLITSLQSIVAGSNSLIKVLISSREEPDILFCFEDFPHVRMSATRTFDDMDTFIEHTVDHHVNAGWLYGQAPSDLIKEVKARLRVGAKGM